jgi:hypothetical protein
LPNKSGLETDFVGRLKLSGRRELFGGIERLRNHMKEVYTWVHVIGRRVKENSILRTISDCPNDMQLLSNTCESRLAAYVNSGLSASTPRTNHHSPYSTTG